METQIWHRDLLVIVHESDGIVYKQETEVEFTPDDSTEQTGEAIAQKPSPEGWQPYMRFRQVIGEPNTLYIALRHRGGYTLIGEHEGHAFTWFFGVAADRYVLNHASIESEAAQVPPVSEEDLKHFRALKPDPEQSTTSDAQPLRIETEFGYIPFDDTTQIVITPTGIDRPTAVLSALDRQDDGTYPQLYVLQAEETADGSIFTGVDADGNVLTWRTGSAALAERSEAVV